MPSGTEKLEWLGYPIFVLTQLTNVKTDDDDDDDNTVAAWSMRGDIPTGTPITKGVECRWGRQKRDSRRIPGCIGHVCIGAYSISTA